MIKFINIALTNRCNLRCVYCDIWKQFPKADISIGVINKLLSSRQLDQDADIALTGGEPFLHEEINSIVRSILDKRPYLLKTISTNGTLLHKVSNFIRQFHLYLPRGFSLHISFDGINKSRLTRRYPSSKIAYNLNKLKERFPGLKIKLKFTVTQLNYQDIMPTYNYAKEEGFEFKIKLVESALNYTNKIEKSFFSFNYSTKKKIISDLLLIKKDIRNIYDLYFLERTISFLLGCDKADVCKVPFNRIFVMPDGSVYSCIHAMKLGNLLEADLKTIWVSKTAKNIRTIISENGCSRCVAYHGFCY